MPAQIEQTLPPIEATYKAREVEGILDLYFYRRIGFRLAQLFAKLEVTPATVSLLGGLLGVIAGHLYYYRDLTTNVVGMLLHVGANTLDNADGQLARLTNAQSPEGRIIDSVADHLVFISIYVHLMLRYLVAGASPAVCFLALAAAISHAVQKAVADYYRSSYLDFVTGRSRADWDSSETLQSNYLQLSWRYQPRHKFLLALYANFTRQQEILSPKLKSLRERARRLSSVEMPDWLRISYRNCAAPMLRWWRLLMTNTRMLMLFLLLLVGQPVWYFWIELIPLNLLLIYLVLRQEKMAQSLLQMVAARPNPA